ncbi:MAG: polyphosphate polymerase domain-containing protein [Verrucomicrobia bacterium]|nr:polyphosphate polymerase domain-containing protein [Verrucomicrobiota bacterium]
MSPSTETHDSRAHAWEIKFLVRPELAEQIRGWARTHLMPDPNALGPHSDSYRIASLYFDTEQFDVFHRRGSYGLGKYRIRRYGQSQTAFLERKLRTRRQLTKRRSIVELGDLERLTENEAKLDWAGYWFHRRLLLRRLAPISQVSYQRTARVAMTQYGPIRLTLDEDLLARPVGGMWFSAPGGKAMCADQIILELKFRHAMPTLFKYLVEEFALNSQPLSKYRLAVSALNLACPAQPVLAESCTYEYA